MEYFNPFLCHPETRDERASQADYQEPPAVLEAFKRLHGILNHIDTDTTTIASVSNAPLPLPSTLSIATSEHSLALHLSAAGDAQAPTNSADTGAGWSTSGSYALPIAVNTVSSEGEYTLSSLSPQSAREPYTVDWPFSPDDTAAFLSLLYEPMVYLHGGPSSRNLTPQMLSLDGTARGSLDLSHPSEPLEPLYQPEAGVVELTGNGVLVQPYGEDNALVDASRSDFAPFYVPNVDDDARKLRGTSYQLAMQSYPDRDEIVSATSLDPIDGGRTASPPNSSALSLSHIHVHVGSHHAVPCHDHRCDNAHNAPIEQDGAPHPNAAQWAAEMQSASLGPHVQTNNTITPTNPPPPSPEEHNLPEVTGQYTPCVFCTYSVLTEVRGTTGTRRCDHFKQHYSGKDDWIPCPKLIELGVTWSVDKKTITAGIENVGGWLIEHHPSLILEHSVFAYGPLGRDLTRWLRQWWNILRLRSPATASTYVEGAKEELRRRREAARQPIAL
ncbi:hypothetical protein EXIGLDRAFT_772941 [Exidia glandulosa HHB12029]|uniref:Uncharacterized protein n=1 Tax=Exidia glandulosa HHB12029 TaxID=1314781 RepID=A0A165F169_EXIGL|nr:hypothetical protein EXIGLDRAFT_772941 [Exidia glandulosa HHB12029]